MIIYSLKYTYKIHENQAYKIFSRFSVLSEGFKPTNWSKLLFYPIFIIRRIFIPLSIVFTNGIIQILMSIIFCTMVKLIRNFLYLVFNNPFTFKKDLILHLVNEFTVFTFYVMIFIQEIKFIQIDEELKTTIYIRIVYAALGFNVLFSLNNIIQKIVSMIKIRRSSARVIHLDIVETGVPSKIKKIS